MKLAKTLTAALVLSSAALMAQSASAADISKPVETIDLSGGGAGFFGRLITGGNRGNTFADSYAFTLTGASTISADTYSQSGNPRNGLDIIGFGLYNAGGLVQQGTRLSTGATDQWQLDLDSLAAGSYFLRVSGSVLSNAAGRAALGSDPVGSAPARPCGLAIRAFCSLFRSRRRRSSRSA